MDLPAYLLTATAAYLLGATPTGYLVARARGVDIRGVGSGNIGATNVMRVLGKPAGIFVLAMDALKGVVASGVLPGLVLNLLGVASAAGPRELLALTGGVAAILGHNYTCWLRFKGGKGIATTAGVLLVLIPAALGLCVALWLLVLAATRYVSAASVAVALGLPCFVWALGGSKAMMATAAILGALAIYKHKTNLRRLLDGSEHRI